MFKELDYKLQLSHYEMWSKLHNNFITRIYYYMKWWFRFGWKKEPPCGWGQDYKVMVTYKMPKHWITEKGYFGIDGCISEEIEFLIRAGVRTLNSCCGHTLKGEVGKPWVIVDEKSIVRMLELGYENQEHPEDKTRKDIFYLKYPITHVNFKKWEGTKEL